MLQASRVGRVRLKLFVRDFSYLQPLEVITVLAILFGNRVHICQKNRRDIFKADTSQNEQTTFLPKRELA